VAAALSRQGSANTPAMSCTTNAWKTIKPDGAFT
jgi:hypothetical protein